MGGVGMKGGGGWGCLSPPILIIQQAGGPQSPLILLLGPTIKKKMSMLLGWINPVVMG